MYEQFARMGKALANPARLELLDLLAQGERSVEELAAAAGMKVSNTSAQLRALAAAGLVAARRDGTRVCYRLAGEEVAAFAGRVQELAASRIAEAERAARGYLGDVAALEPVARDELFRRQRTQEVLVLDVRPAAEYAAGHIPGAVSVPHDQLAARLSELPAGPDIVAYCRGRYCVFPPDPARLLRRPGLSPRPPDATQPSLPLPPRPPPPPP